MCLTKAKLGGKQVVLLSVCLHLSVGKVRVLLLRYGRKKKLASLVCTGRSY